MQTPTPAHTPDILAVQVARVEPVADGVRRVTLRRRDGRPFPAWEAGSHIDVIMPDHLRQYSLCSSPADLDEVQIGVLRVPDSRGGSAWIHESLREGDDLLVSAPRNNFPFLDSRRYLFIAGGIGITPLLPMIEAAEQQGREWTLVYGGRSRRTMAFLDDLQARHGDQVIAYPADETGRLDLARHLAMPRAKMLIYACGPDALLRDLEDWARGWPPGVLHTERFAAANLDAGASMEPFEVELTRSGTTVTVTRDQTVLDAVEAVGVRVLSSCRAGVCGTCETDVLAGDIEHRDAVLSAAERESQASMMVCVSRAAAGCSRLTLDL